ncbi:hypothetical protein DXG01_001359 [Tephrocybe rancida]|nr:hypothetical protein DXG01_001359 [Tephrocybe rancida]
MHDRTLRDILPQPPTPLLPPTPIAEPHPPSVIVVSSVPPSANAATATVTPTHVDSAANVFGVFRRYHHSPDPTHDPEAAVGITSLSNLRPVVAGATSSTSLFDPYPNEASFQLGHWFWAKGGQKSQESFCHLIGIVRAESFQPLDIWDINWPNINAWLGLNSWDDSKEEWEDEDASWKVSPVPLRIPFHRFTDNPGVRDFIVRSFYHCSLVEVIREKLTLKKQDIRHFHIDPHELYWQQGESQEPVCLYGEMYTSPSFLSAYQALQDSPPEPGCMLAQYVVGIMLWSDATHLTDFGTSRLTPVYLYFSNESKYR